MPSQEFTDWIAFYELNPFGEERADVRHAINTASVVNCWSKKAYKPKDFMPKFGPTKDNTHAETKAFFLKLSLTGDNGIN